MYWVCYTLIILYDDVKFDKETFKDKNDDHTEKKKTSRKSEGLQGQGAYKNKVNDEKKTQAN